MQVVDLQPDLEVPAAAFVAFGEADGGLDPRGLTWLTPSEAAYAGRLTAVRRRSAWLAGRLAAKTAVVHLAPVLVAERVEVLPAANGAPVVRGVPGGVISVSISHTRDLAVAVAFEHAGGSTGVDVEVLDQPLDPSLLAFAFSADERAAIEARGDGGDIHNRTLAFWTAKEASLKAVRRGLSLPLGAVCLAWSDGGEPIAATVQTAPSLRAQLHLQTRVFHGYVMSVAREADNRSLGC